MADKSEHPIPHLLAMLQSEDDAAVERASRALVEEVGAAAVPALAGLLQVESARIRDTAAIVLRRIGDASAVRPLVDAIRSRLTVGHRGTLVYALNGLDCAGQFLPLVEMALFDQYEVQSLALIVLRNQDLEPTLGDLDEARRRVGNARSDRSEAAPPSELLRELDSIIEAAATSLGS